MSLFSFSKNKISPVVLVMYDGWGLAPPTEGNAITRAKTPNMDSFYKLYPHGELIASGESVGLPAGEVGNSEVGHLTAGVGRVIYQSLKRINISIEKGDFYENEAFLSAIDHANRNNSNLHIMGLVGGGNVHSTLDHLLALIQLVKNKKFDRLFLHLFTDGRDSAPTDGINAIRKIEEKINVLHIGQIATISGRYYAMDRDARWERIQKVYDAMTLGKGLTATTAEVAMQASYDNGKTDEFVEPVIIQEPAPPPPISSNDACIFFNFRVDRARELTMAFSISDFENIKVQDYGFNVDDQNNDSTDSRVFNRTKKLDNLFFVTMTEYQKNIPVQAIAFPPQHSFPDSLPEVLSKNNFPQFHLAESEKERMVTYYFRGMNSSPFSGEDIKIVPSPKVPTYDKKPEMSAYGVLKAFKQAIKKNKYHFFVLNFANPDMVAHSGNIDAAIKAIEVVDDVIGKLLKELLKHNGTLFISADHGNAEEMLTFPSDSFYYTTDQGVMNTDHSSNPVPLVIASNVLRGKSNIVLKGTLADIAPTILGVMNLPIPEVMEGRDLLASSR